MILHLSVSVFYEYGPRGKAPGGGPGGEAPGSSCAFQCGYSISNANLYTSDCQVKDIANKNKTL